MFHPAWPCDSKIFNFAMVDQIAVVDQILQWLTISLQLDI